MSLSARDRRRCLPLGVFAVLASCALIASGGGHGSLLSWPSVLVLVSAAVLSAATVHYVSDGDVFTWGLVEVSIGLAAPMARDRWVLAPLAVGIAAGFGYKMSRQPVRACLNAAMYITGASFGLAMAGLIRGHAGLVTVGFEAAVASVSTSGGVYLLSTWALAHISERPLSRVVVGYLKPDGIHATLVAVFATLLGILAGADMRAAAAAVVVSALLLPQSAARLQAKAEARQLRATLDGVAEVIRATDPATAEEGLLRLARQLTGIGGLALSAREDESEDAEPATGGVADSSIFVVGSGPAAAGHRLLHEAPERILDRLAVVGGAALDATRRGQVWRNLAELDPLTGLLNRRAFIDALEQHIAKPGAALPCMVVFVDLDGFKVVNDEFGHEAGDILLRAISVELLRSTRHGDVCARFGGDEFCMLLIEDTSHVRGEAMRTRIMDAVSQAARGESRRVSASIGFASFPEEARSAAGLLQLADQRMYANKRARRSAVR